MHLKLINRRFILLFTLGCVLTSCLNNNNKLSKILDQKPQEDQVMKRIRETGKIVALTDYNSTNYFIYRGEALGYQFDLLKNFADHLGVKLDIVTSNDLSYSFDCLKNGKVDIVAIGLAKTSERNKIVDFSLPLGQSRQVLIQRKPLHWRKMKTMDEINNLLIRDPLKLAKKTIVIQKGTSFKKRLLNLSEEIGDSIFIIENPDKEVEELIEMVASGKIDYTISDEHIALVNQRYYPDIDVHTPISFNQNLSWAVNKGQDSLLFLMNEWISEFTGSLSARLLYNKYFKNKRTLNYAQSEFHSVGGGKISKYDDIVKEISGKYNMDWRFVSSIIYQESGFKPYARSWVGAYGLMQLMPATAEMFGIDTLASPKDQIEAGVKFIKWLDKQIPKEIEGKSERMKFILAAYNAGLAHVLDARRLAKKYNRNPNIWTGSVDTFLLKKSIPKYYRDSVVRYGYCRGEESFKFVIDILDRYDHYKNLIKN
jgi:membrane-bound lytic murein transglycosylase F